MDDNNAILYMIPLYYTGFLQPFDVGINKSLKDRFKKVASDWRRDQYTLLEPGKKLPSSEKKDIFVWVKNLGGIRIFCTYFSYGKR